ncbi:MAG TPA: hypothetical protein VKH64_09315 [Candidatus Binatia bacterium]|nr:hypothetical protein [Candidatus Binatia bacterium]
MKPVVGIFVQLRGAEAAVKDLRTQGIVERNINLLFPGVSEDALRRLPTDEGEQPGMGEAVGAVVGTGLGASSGAYLGVAANALIPGIGPVVAIGAAAAALLGIAGAVGGAAAGGALEDALSDGLPKDEWFVYEDALRQGRAIVIVSAADDEQAETVRRTLEHHGAESVDAARERWWIGLRSAEAEHYQNGDFKAVEPRFRRGFEAALHPAVRGRPYETVTALLRQHCPNEYQDPAFRDGYRRGQEYCRQAR